MEINMANEAWFAIIVMCLAPAVIIFVVAGLVLIGKQFKTNKLSSSEEIDHEL